jgi:hypothetical protein
VIARRKYCTRPVKPKGIFGARVLLLRKESAFPI